MPKSSRKYFPDDFLAYNYFYEIQEIKEAAELHEERKLTILSQRFFEDESKNKSEIEKFIKLFTDYDKTSNDIIFKKDIKRLAQYEEKIRLLNIINAQIDELVETHFFIRRRAFWRKKRISFFRQKDLKANVLSWRQISTLINHQNSRDIANRYGLLLMLLLSLLSLTAIYLYITSVKGLAYIIVGAVLGIILILLLIGVIAVFGPSIQQLDHIRRIKYRNLPKQKSVFELKALIKLIRLIKPY